MPPQQGALPEQGALPQQGALPEGGMLPDQGTLADQAGRAFGWSFTSNALARLGTTGIGIMLARLLGPHAFGTYAVALVALNAILSFNDLSVSLAIVRWPGDPREIAPTVTTIAVCCSVAIYIGCFIGAPAYASAMGSPAATEVIRVLAFNVVLDGLTATPATLLQRYFRQDKKMIADQVNNWLGAGVSIGLAWAGYGAMSLAIGRMAGALAAAVLFVAFSPEPLRFGFDRARAGGLLRYGTPLAGSTIVVFAVTNLDQLVAGRMLGATALGFYVLAFNLAAWPITIFSRPVRSVAPAAFSRLQHDRRAMRSGFLSAAALLGAVALPACLVISGSATPLVAFVYGARWLPAAHALMWLALLAALRIFFELIYDYFVVLARARAVFTVQLGWLLVLIPALIAGAKADGIYGIGAAEVAVAACVILPWYLSELRRVGILRRALCARLWLPFVTAVIAGLAAWGAAQVAPNNLTALAVSGAAALAALGLLFPRLRKEVALLRTGTGGQDGLPASAPSPSASPSPSPSASAPVAAGLPSGAPGVHATSGPAGSSPDGWRDPARASAAGPDVLLARPVYQDITGPLPIYRDLNAQMPAYRDLNGRMHSRRSAADTSPLYQQTVASLCWDPATATHSSHGSSDARHARNGRNGSGPGIRGS